MASDLRGDPCTEHGGSAAEPLSAEVMRPEPPSKGLELPFLPELSLGCLPGMLISFSYVLLPLGHFNCIRSVLMSVHGRMTLCHPTLFEQPCEALWIFNFRSHHPRGGLKLIWPPLLPTHRVSDRDLDLAFSRGKGCQKLALFTDRHLQWSRARIEVARRCLPRKARHY